MNYKTDEENIQRLAVSADLCDASLEDAVRQLNIDVYCYVISCALENIDMALSLSTTDASHKETPWYSVELNTEYQPDEWSLYAITTGSGLFVKHIVHSRGA